MPKKHYGICWLAPKPMPRCRRWTGVACAAEVPCRLYVGPEVDFAHCGLAMW